MSTLLNFARDVQGLSTQSSKFSTDIYSATLVEATNTTLTVPSNFSNWLAVISVQYGKEVWVALNAAAAAPASGSFTVSTGELINPYYPYTFCKQVKSADVLNFFSVGSTADISVSFYALQQTN
jgi:hypothetical protein